MLWGKQEDGTTFLFTLPLPLMWKQVGREGLEGCPFPLFNYFLCTCIIVFGIFNGLTGKVTGTGEWNRLSLTLLLKSFEMGWGREWRKTCPTSKLPQSTLSVYQGKGEDSERRNCTGPGDYVFHWSLRLALNYHSQMCLGVYSPACALLLFFYSVTLWTFRGFVPRTKILLLVLWPMGSSCSGRQLAVLIKRSGEIFQ